MRPQRRRQDRTEPERDPQGRLYDGDTVRPAGWRRRAELLSPGPFPGPSGRPWFPPDKP